MKVKTINSGVSFVIGALMLAPVIQDNIYVTYAANVQAPTTDTAKRIAEKIKTIEKNQFSINSYFGKTATKTQRGVVTPIVNKNELGYKYVKGSVNVLISAPHTLKQPARPGKQDYKLADAYTGAIAQYIAEKTGAHLIYKTSYTGEDDNFKGYGIDNPTKDQTRTPYRDKIEEIINKNQINLVIDLHGFADSSEKGYGVEFGTNEGSNLLNNKKLLNEILRSFEDNGFAKLNTKAAKGLPMNKVYAIDEYFSANIKNRTVTNYVATSLKTPAIQIEFSRSNRDPENVANLKRTVDTLIDVINNVSSLESSTTSNVDILNPSVSAQVKSYSSSLRKSPSYNSDELIKIKKDAYVSILEETNSTWVKVKYNDAVGYVKAEDLKRVAQVANVKSYLNFREEADINSPVIARIQENECVTVLEEYNSGWVKVSYGGTYGYVHGKYLKIVNPATVVEDKISQIDYVTKKTVVDVKSYLNLRESTNKNSTSIAKIKKGEKVNFIKQENSTWSKVAYEDMIGYVNSKYLK